MQKDFYILGEIVNADSERFSEEDLCPQAFKKFIWDLKSGDKLVLHMNSVGGSVYGGMTIANFIRELNEKGVETIAIVEGIAASIASVIACACQKIQMYESSFMMIHKAWTVMQGNADDMKKQADVMDKIDAAIRSFHKSKFDLTDSQLESVMQEETWIQGKEANAYMLDCEVIPSEMQFKVAACLKNKGFVKIPKGLIMENKEEIKNETVEVVEETKTVENEASEHAESVEQKTEETEKIVDAIEPETKAEVVTKAEADKRVSGMQSTMQNKINTLTKEYEAKISEFQNQLKAKDEELTSVRAEVTSLTQRLEDSTKELQAAASALEEKKSALAMLNANVNTPNEQTDWKALKGKAFFDWYKKNH